MLRRLILETFMSHKLTTIELSEGLTVLTGPNNCGKSAIVAALQTLADNPRGSGYVMRHGEKVARITVETDDDHVVTWQRKKTPSYIIDGEDVHRVGTDLPEDLSGILRLGKVEIEPGKTKVEYDIHFGDQKSPIFLLNEPGSYAAAFFASSSDATHLLAMQALHRSRVKENKAKSKLLTAETERVSAKLKQFDPVDELDTRVKTAEQTFQKITNTSQQIQTLTDLIAQIQTCESAKRHSEQTLGHLNKLDTHNDTPTKLDVAVTAAGDLRQAVETLDRIQQQIAVLAATRQATEVLADPPSLHDTPALKRLAATLHETSTRKKQLASETAACESLNQPPQLHDSASAAKLIASLRRTNSSRTILARGANALSSLREPPTLEPVSECDQSLHGLRSSMTKQAVLKDKFSALKSLDTPPVPRDVKELKHSIAVIASSKRASREIQASVAKLSDLKPPPELTPPDEIDSALVQLRAATGLQQQQQHSAQAAASELANCFTQIEQYASEHPKCETCGGVIKAENVVSVAGHLHPNTGTGESK